MNTTIMNYEEGRTAATRRLRRRIDEHGDLSSQVESLVLRDEAAYWRNMLLRHADAEIPSLTWLAYSCGGLALVESLLVERDSGGPGEARLAV